MTQEDLNIVVDCVRYGAPALSNKVLENLAKHLDEFNKYKRFYNNTKAKEAKEAKEAEQKGDNENAGK